MTERSDRVEFILNSPEFQEAFDTVREKYRDMIEDTPVSDDGALLDIRKMLHLLREVEQHLRTAVRDGKLEDFRAQEQQGGILQDLKLWPRKVIR